MKEPEHDIYRMALEQNGADIRRNNDVMDAVSYQAPQLDTGCSMKLIPFYGVALDPAKLVGFSVSRPRINVSMDKSDGESIVIAEALDFFLLADMGNKGKVELKYTMPKITYREPYVGLGGLSQEKFDSMYSFVSTQREYVDRRITELFEQRTAVLLAEVSSEWELLCGNQDKNKVLIVTADAYGEVKTRKPTTSLDWELTQAIAHLKSAIAVTDSHRAHLLLSAVQIAKGVRESD